MKNITARFNLYDFTAYVLVGFYQLAVILIVNIQIGTIQLSEVQTIFTLEGSFLLLLTSYFIGQVVQAFSNVFEVWEKKKKNDEPNELKFVFDKAKAFFGLADDASSRVVFNYCYLYSLSNDFSGHIVLFNAMYSLYRGLYYSSIINIFICIGFFVGAFFGITINIGLVMIFILHLFFVWLFMKRKSRFLDYLNEKVLITFDILVSMEDEKKV